MNLEIERDVKRFFTTRLDFYKQHQNPAITELKQVYKASLRFIHLIDEFESSLIGIERSGFWAVTKNHYVQIFLNNHRNEICIKFVNFDNHEFDQIFAFTDENKQDIIQTYFKITYLAYI